MAKEKKAKVKSTVGLKEITAEEKSKMKGELKALKTERNAAIGEGDKKKLKAARFKIKKLKLKLKRVTVPEPKAPEAPAEEAPAAAGAPAGEAPAKE